MQVVNVIARGQLQHTRLLSEAAWGWGWRRISAKRGEGGAMQVAPIVYGQLHHTRLLES
jgi:hypothetical protein